MTVMMASPLGLAAAALYFLVVVASAVAAVAANRHRQQHWHVRYWIFVLLLFSLLIVSRLFDLEEQARDWLREVLRENAQYNERRNFQRPLVAGLLGGAGLAAMWWIYLLTKSLRGRRNFAAAAGMMCGLGMVLLIGLRMISLHAIDALLYGPVKLNWVADVGLTIVAAGSAIYYVRIVRRR